MDQAVILSAVRTPIGKFQGGLATLSAPQLGAKVVAEAVRRAGIEPKSVDEVIMGNVVQAGWGRIRRGRQPWAAGSMCALRP
jgi:acetyl-CoA C-acetyltransferase